MLIKKRQYNWKYILPMAFFIAWLWSYPLFGHLQESFLYDESEFFNWNLLFLSGLSIGFFGHAFKASERLPKIKIPTIVLTALVFMFLSSINTASCFLLGISTSIYMIRWSSKLVLLKKDEIGSHMGMMMLLASFLYSMLWALGDNALSIYIAYGFLALSSLFSESEFDGENLVIEPSNENLELKFCVLRFWLPFILILFSFYIFSTVLLNYIFPSARTDAPYMYLLASLTYGLAAMLAGMYLDRFKKPENIVLLGIIFLGIFYFLSPILASLYLINIGLELSYALIDLFIWVGIAYASITFGYNPVRCFGFGLGMNIFFIIIGLLANDIFTKSVGPIKSYSIPLIVGIMMLISIFPALSMKHINILKDVKSKHHDKRQKAPDNLTPREKQVFKLLMTKMTNDEIQNRLSISKNTLKTHIRNIYAKSGVKSRYELIVKHKDILQDKK
ncbi:MAG: LuxR C-terminal-related transcriptional regulator [Dethiosulfatibacter sp.]|nr:LuxR C-terminal-related transcriptional regulator [Dethiosulfatibacter sp.]